jgi:ABC-2 type transport system permease protein
LFERITLSDLRVAEPRAVRRPDGRWDVSMQVTATKSYADGEGRLRPAELAERIEVGLFAEDPDARNFNRSSVIYLERRAITAGTQTLRFVADERPTHAGVDPYHFYIDRNAEDNVAPIRN